MSCSRWLPRWRPSLLAGALAVAALAAPLVPAVAAPTPILLEEGEGVTATSEIIVLHATNDGAGIDPEIGDVPQLEKAPFSSFDSYKLLDRGKVKLSPKGERSLPDGGKLAVEVTSVEDGRYAISASVFKKGGKKFLPAVKVNAKKKEYFFIAGQKYQEGILVIGIRILGS